MTEPKESELAKLKKHYADFQGKYSLPDFDKLNEDFDVEKLAGGETDFLLREIRKNLGERLANFLRFVELMLNPSNAPMFVFHLVKNLEADDKKILEETYKLVVEFEVRMIELDMDYGEKKEAQFIVDVFNSWQMIKKEIMKVHASIVKNWSNGFKKKDKSYFG